MKANMLTITVSSTPQSCAPVVVVRFILLCIPQTALRQLPVIFLYVYLSDFTNDRRVPCLYVCCWIMSHPTHPDAAYFSTPSKSEKSGPKWTEINQPKSKSSQSRFLLEKHKKKVNPAPPAFIPLSYALFSSLLSREFPRDLGPKKLASKSYVARGIFRFPGSSLWEAISPCIGMFGWLTHIP